MGSIGLDPLDIASDAAEEISLLVFHITQSVSLDDAVSKAEEVLSKVDGIIYTYANEVSHRKIYYEGLKKAYEDNYGPIDEDAKPQKPPPNYCVRGDLCTMKVLSNPANSEEHQRVCPHKIDGWFFGLGERDCPGHIYICDSSYQCSDWADHLQTGGCGHRYPNRDIDQHKMLMPGPCGHDHYACDKAHQGKLLSCGVHYEYKCSPLTNTQKTDHNRYVSCNYCNYYGTLCQIPYPCMGNPNPGGYHNLR